MANHGVIAAYLGELRFSVARLPDVDDIVAEAEDHLLEAADRLLAAGHSMAEAQTEAVARFGSAALVARICMTQAKQGAAVPTTRTRWAGLAAALSPLLLAFGQWGNVTVDRGAAHGIAVAMLTFAFPAFAFGLWGLRARHGGLGRLGRAALVLAFVAPVVSLAAEWAAPVVLIPLVSVAVVVFAVEMLRASVLPVAPLALLAAGAVVALVETAVGAVVTAGGGDAGHPHALLVFLPLALIATSFVWLGWCLWSEPAADRGRVRPLPAG